MDDIAPAWRRNRRDYETYLRLEKGLADNSVQAYLRDFDHLARFMSEQGTDSEHVTLEQLQQLLAQLNDTGIAPTSQRRMIAGWRMFFHMLVVDDAIKDSPADLLDLPLRPKHLPDVLTDEDITKLQQTFDLSLPDQYRNNVIVEVLYGCGLRVSELVNLKLSNIYEQEQARAVYQTMGRVLSRPAYIICGDSDFERSFGQKADKRRKLYNGMIKCELYMYL